MITVLIVDDFASVRLFHANLLKAQGWKCETAKCAEDALVLLGHTKVDAIVLDLVMPGMGGKAFLAQLRERKEYAKLPVVVITSEAQALQEDEVTVVLIKPVLPKLLVESVRGHVLQGGPTP